MDDPALVCLNLELGLADPESDSGENEDMRVDDSDRRVDDADLSGSSLLVYVCWYIYIYIP